jgi:hypothetical protein
MKDDAQKPKKKKKGRPPIHTHCTVPGCDRKHYAKGMCWKHYRVAQGYPPGGDRKVANEKYDHSERGKARSQRSSKKRYVLRKLTGLKVIGDMFENADAIAKLRTALREGDSDLALIWTWLTPEQQDTIQGKTKTPF